MLSYVLFAQGLACPHIAAGADLRTVSNNGATWMLFTLEKAVSVCCTLYGWDFYEDLSYLKIPACLFTAQCKCAYRVLSPA